jgi:outer membrane lipoprotein-sorting protein
MLAVGLMGFQDPSAIGADTPVAPHAILQRMAHAYDNIQDYTALFIKRERIDGKLGPLEKIQLRFQEPFKVYMAWQEPHAGRVVTYIKGENNNKLQVNPGGKLGFLHLSLDPDGAMAMRGSHNSVRQAGLHNAITLIIDQYQRGKQHNQVQLILHGEAAVDGRPAYHLEWICPAEKSAGYYAYRGELWIDQEYYLPTRMDIYNWDNQLYAHYAYHQLRLNPGLSDEAFQLDAAVSDQPSPPTEIASH